MRAIRALLGVRATTPKDLCLVEAGLSPISGIVRNRQKKFLKKLIEDRSALTDDPFMHAINITSQLNNPLWKYMEEIMNGGDFVADEFRATKERILNREPSATRYTTYVTLNPSLNTHKLYTQSCHIPDYLRITFTRYRLSSHRLRVELGRWSRTTRELRICQCGNDVQDEFHIFRCPIVADLTNTSAKTYNNPQDIFASASYADLRTLDKILDRLDGSEI